MSEVLEHVGAIEKRLGEVGQDLDPYRWLDIRVRLAELRLKLERHDHLQELVAELRPAMLRLLRGGLSPLDMPDNHEDYPTVVCLCGSTKFMGHFHEAGWQETLAGRIVLSVGVSKHLPADHGGESLGPEVCAALDALHLRKIELADEVLVLNVGGYVGESTTAEVEHAYGLGKLVRWLEPDAIPERFREEHAAQLAAAKARDVDRFRIGGLS